MENTKKVAGGRGEVKVATGAAELACAAGSQMLVLVSSVGLGMGLVVVLFVLVHEVVDLGDNVFLFAGVGEYLAADRGRELIGLAGCFVVFFDGVEDLLPDAVDVVILEAADDDDELIAGETDDDTFVADDLYENVGKRTERGVALRMGVIVVDRLKAVEIEHQSGNLLTTKPGKCFSEIIKLIAVIDTGQLVDVDALILKADDKSCKCDRIADRLQGHAIDETLDDHRDDDRCQELPDREIAERRAFDLRNEVIRVTVDDQKRAREKKDRVERIPVIDVAAVDVEYDRPEKIHGQKHDLDRADGYEKKDLQARDRLVDVVDDEVDDAESDEQIINI